MFMSLPSLVLTVIPMCLLPYVKGVIFDGLLYVLWINAIIAGADINNSVLIAIKPAKAVFYRGYYKIDVTVQSQPQKLAFFRCGVFAKYIFTVKHSRMRAFITFNCKNMSGSEQLPLINKSKIKIVFIIIHLV